MTDAIPENIQRVLDGDRDAYADIVRRHQDMLLAYAGFRIPDRDLADEVVQQTFIRAYEQLRDFRPDGDFGAWLRAICRFVALGELKRRLRERHHAGNVREYLRQLVLSGSPSGGEGDADLLRRLEGCLGKLPAPQRALLDRRYRENESVNELALRYQRTVTWVTTVLFRVRGMLRKCMERQAKLEGGVS